MDRVEYEERIRELESQLSLMEERCHILMETTTALLFEYHPREDRNRGKRLRIITSMPGSRSRCIRTLEAGSVMPLSGQRRVRCGTKLNI